MSFDWYIQWTRTNAKNSPIQILDCITANISKSVEIQNNLCNLTLKNSSVFQANDDNKTIIGEYVETGTQEVKFGEEDELRIWAVYHTDASVVGTTTWLTDANLIGSFAVEEYQVQTIENSSRVQLQAVDSAYLMFNKVYNFSYGISNKFTSPGIVRHCARKFCESTSNTITTYTGTDNDLGVEYAVDAKFLSEGGNIQDYRDSPTTTINGSLNNSATTINVTSTAGFEDGDGTIVIDGEHISYTGITGTSFTGCTRGIDDTSAEAHSNGTTVYQGFPLILMSMVWRPLFEWIGEISQTENTNYLSETTEGGTLNYGRAFIFWIDKNNSVHWVYPDNNPDLTITLSEEGRRAFRLDKSVFDAVNFIIYNSGEDMYGNGIIYYLFDETSEIASLKMRYQPMSKIVFQLIDEDRKINTSRVTTETDIYRQFPLSYPVVPSFLSLSNKFRATGGLAARTNVTSNTEYNDALREAAKQKGFEAAQKIVSKRSGLRYKGQLAIKGTNINPGDLVSVTNPFVGLNSKLLRVVDVSHSINQNGWETTLEVEEDEKEL